VAVADEDDVVGAQPNRQFVEVQLEERSPMDHLHRVAESLGNLRGGPRRQPTKPRVELAADLGCVGPCACS
jgi:hypothetical protein